MVRHQVDYEARKRAVLAAAINLYIKEAVPVASEDIARLFDLSPATIRNIFAELEESGYLMHPYTSGGRIPTDRGYRYYVDFLIAQMELIEEEKQLVVDEYNRRINRLDDVLEKTSELISAMTHYAGMVSFLEWQDKLFYRGLSRVLEQPEFQTFDKIRLLVKSLEDKQRLLDIINQEFAGKTKVYIGAELGFPEMANCSVVVSSYRRHNRPSGRVAVLGPARMQYEHIIPVLEFVSEAVSGILETIEER